MPQGQLARTVSSA